MIKSKFKRVTSLFLATLMCVTTFAGIGSTTAYAASGEKADVYMVDFPRDGDANYDGVWGHSNLTLKNGWHTGRSNFTNLKAIGSYSGNVAYCIEPGISLKVGQTMNKYDENYFNNLAANGVISGDEIRLFVAMVFTVVLSVSTFFIIRNHIDSAKQNEVYDNLAEIVEDEPPKENEGVTFSEDKDYLAEYLELYRQNEDMVGWIKVEDTNINYPVVQSVNEPNFYLKHKFDKTYSAYGCPYVQENCDVQKPSDNIIIYGHHMNDGSMFTGLMKYRNKSFWEGHKTITFDTLTDRHQYEVIAVFKTVVYTDSSDSFKYYEFTDAENAAEFDAYVAKCKELSLYDTRVSAEYGDKLISLSTCEYSRNNGRLVVVAKRVD